MLNIMLATCLSPHFFHHVPSTVNLFLLASKFFSGSDILLHRKPVRTIEITERFHTSQQIHDMTFRPKFLWTSFCWPNLASLGCFFLRGCSSHSGHCCNHRLNWSKGDGNLTVFAYAFYMRVLLGGVLNFKNKTTKTTQITSWYMIRSRGFFLQPSYSISFLF